MPSYSLVQFNTVHWVRLCVRAVYVKAGNLLVPLKLLCIVTSVPNGTLWIWTQNLLVGVHVFSHFPSSHCFIYATFFLCRGQGSGLAAAGIVAGAQSVTYSNLINLILLDVNDNKVDDAGAEDIKCIVAGHPTLLMLGLESNNIGEAGCNSLADLVLHLDVRYTTRENYKILDGEITYFPSPPAPTCFINTTLMCLVLDDNPEGSLEYHWKNDSPFPHVTPGDGFISDKFVYVESIHLYDDLYAVAAGEMSYAYNNAEKKIEDILESARNEADEVPPPSGVTDVTGVY